MACLAALPHWPLATEGGSRDRRGRLAGFVGPSRARPDQGQHRSHAPVNDYEARFLVRFCLDRGHQLGFVEQMPLDARHTWRRATVITATEIFRELGRDFVLTVMDEPRNDAPAERWLVDERHPAGEHVVETVTSRELDEALVAQGSIMRVPDTTRPVE
jgi:hypothetical protein